MIQTAKYPGRLQAIEELAEIDAWLEACNQCHYGNITETMARRASELELEYAALTDEELRERWENGPWNL